MARAHKITAAEAREARWSMHHAEPGRWFWRRVNRDGGNEACWPWLGRAVKGRGGYGRLVFKGKSLGAHRMALILASGEERPEEFACHRCDNPICCNPAHLFWGSPKDNVDDCVAKGRKRGAPPKIDLARMKSLRAAGRSYTELAAEFHVNQASIAKALKRLGLNGPIRPNQNALRARDASLVEVDCG